MIKRISASDAKNNFGGFLEDVAALGRVEIVRHGRVVAVVFSPRSLDSSPAGGSGPQPDRWGWNHMIPPERARAARILGRLSHFDED